MTNRARPRGRAAAVWALVVVTCLLSACSSGSSSPPGSSAPSPPGTRANGSDVASSTTPAGSTPPGTGVSAGATATLRAGWNVVAAAPERYTNDFDALLHDFGQDVSVAFGSAGAPVVAWASLTDSSSNGYTISTSTLDPAVGWLAPVEVARVRLAPGPTGRLFSFTGSVTSGVLAVAYERRDDNGTATGVDVVVSTDAGKTWVRSTAVETEAYHPAVTIAGDTLLVVHAGTDGYALASVALPPRPPTEPTAPVDTKQLAWKHQPLAGLEGFSASDAQPAVLTSPAGRPAAATLLASTNGGRRAVAYVGLDDPTTASKAIEVDRVEPGGSSVSLAFRDGQPVVSATFEPRPQNDVLAYVATSPDGGASFTPPVNVKAELDERAPFGASLAVSGPPSTTTPGSTTTIPVITADPAAPTTTVPVAGSAIIVYEPDTVDPAAKTCGLPRVISSADLMTWTTCAPGTTTATPGMAVQPANLQPLAVAGPDGRLYIAVTNRDSSAGVPLGIALWRSA